MKIGMFSISKSWELYCSGEKVEKCNLVKYSRKGAADVTEISRILALEYR